MKAVPLAHKWSLRRPRGAVAGLPIGCDIQSQMVRAVQFQPDATGNLRVVAKSACISESQPATEPWWSELEAAIRSIFHDHSFLGRKVVFSLPPFARAAKSIELTEMPDEEIAGAAVWQLAKELNLPASQLTCDAVSMSHILKDEQTKKLEVIAFAGHNPAACRIADMLVAHGLEPLAIDHVTCAIARGICLTEHTAGSFRNETLVVVEIERDDAILVIVHDGEPRLVRRFNRGESRFEQIVAKRMNIDTDQARQMRDAMNAKPSQDEGPVFAQAVALYGQELARELVMTIRHHMAHTRDGWPASGIVVGPADLSPMSEILSGHTGIEFRTELKLPGEGWSQSDIANDVQSNPHAWLAPAGLSLYQYATTGADFREVA